MRIQWSAVPHPMLSSSKAMCADTPVLPFNTRDRVPRSQLRRALVVVTVLTCAAPVRYRVDSSCRLIKEG